MTNSVETTGLSYKHSRLHSDFYCTGKSFISRILKMEKYKHVLATLPVF